MRFWVKKEKNKLFSADLVNDKALAKKFDEFFVKQSEKPNWKDILVVKKRIVISYGENNEKIEKLLVEKTNLTRYVNESAKVLKQQTAAKLRELKRVFTEEV